MVKGCRLTGAQSLSTHALGIKENRPFAPEKNRAFSAIFMQQTYFTRAAALFLFEFQNQATFVIPAIRAGPVRQAHFIALRAAG
jgi:hypothetical protein